VMGHEASGCCAVDKKLCYRLCVILCGTALASWELLSNLPEFFFWGVFLSGLCSGFVSSRRAYYGLVWAFSISVFSPVVKRGKLCSGNRGLGIGIRADNSRFFALSRSSGGTLGARGSVAKTPVFSWNISCLAGIIGETG
jgi:hypothetical protein